MMTTDSILKQVWEGPDACRIGSTYRIGRDPRFDQPLTYIVVQLLEGETTKRSRGVFTTFQEALDMVLSETIKGDRHIG